jgi:hypothetical protein
MTFHQFLLETVAIFVGDVLASAFIALMVYLAWYLLKYPGFRIGASWNFTGWNVKQMGRFPNASDSVPMTFTPSIGITSYDTTIKKLIHSVWVRQRADPQDPGNILGHRDLQQDGVLPEHRTTGGDLVRLVGPTISCTASRFQEVVSYPVFIETSDGAFYKAESVGNAPEGLTGFRYRCRNALYKVRRQVFSFKSFLRERILRGRQH